MPISMSGLSRSNSGQPENSTANDITTEITYSADHSVGGVDSCAVVVLVLTIDITSSIAVSGVAVLTYYAVTNAAAFALGRDQRRWPRALAVVGLLGCVVLAAALPPSALLGGGLVLVTGVAARQVAVRRSGDEHP